MRREQTTSRTKAAYDVVADLYADTFTATEPEQPVELAMIDHFVSLLNEPRRVLDAGCGAGRMLPYLAGRGCQPLGVDLSPEMIRRARLDHPGFETAVGSLLELDLPDDELDGVLAWYSTIHTPDADLPSLLGELVRVMRPGGHLLVAFQVGSGVQQVGPAYARHGLDVDLVRHRRTLTQMVAALEAQGLDVVAQLERAPVAPETDGQGVVIARRRGEAGPSV